MARDNSEAASLAFSNRSNILTLRRSKAMKGTSLSGFCTIVTHREGIAQVVYAYIGTRKLRNSGRTSGVSLPNSCANFAPPICD